MASSMNLNVNLDRWPGKFLFLVGKAKQPESWSDMVQGELSWMLYSTEQWLRSLSSPWQPW